jgi:hypothetical protein
MPHAKIAIVSAVNAANTALGEVQQGVIADADTLSELATALDLVGDLEAIERLYPETQTMILQAIKAADAAGRRPYLTWRHSAIQRLEITVPSPDRVGLPMDIAIHSRYVGDGLGANPG